MSLVRASVLVFAIEKEIENTPCDSEISAVPAASFPSFASSPASDPGVHQE